MADAHSTCYCRKCGSEFERKSRQGRPRVVCHKCSRKPNDIGASLTVGSRSCLRCGIIFDAKQNQKFCSARCKNGTKLTREQYRDSVRRQAKSNFVCITCGKNHYRKESATNKAAGYENKFCSRDCLKQHYERLRNAKLEFSDHTSEEKRRLIRSEILGIRRLGKSSYKPTKKRCECLQCGTEFIATVGGGLYKQKCDSCLDSNKRVHRKIAKAKRRAVCKGVHAESVNPFVVFDRDKWRCKICGCKTPRSKRGTYDDDAPELDHIVPISKGGSHTYKNTQCACRKCNGLKSDRPFGQMLLIG